MRKYNIVGLVCAVFATMALALAHSAPPAAAAPAADQSVDPSTLGTTAATAAGSCWEIKQYNPNDPDGDYWLLTPAMNEPQQFYCDMTTDGGGWVLVGKGRNGWNKNINAVGGASALLTPDTAPMTSAAAQYSGTTIDGLLNNGRVDALDDGVRLRRATDTAGTSWQEVRMNFSSSDHWTWAFGAINPLRSWSFDGTSGTGGTSKDFGSDNAYHRVTNIPASSNGYSVGFAYGSRVSGSSSSTSYLWSPSGGGGAAPYTDVFIRPHITSSDTGFTSIPDSGTAAETQPSVMDSNALPNPWGVAGLAGSTSVEGSVEVQAFVQSGDNMYVGGNFKYVQQDASGTGQVQQSFLAAFNVNTGQWVSTFRPQLNEQVRTLVALPNGDVVAGGVFSEANGQPVTGIVALNPTTGATDPSWHLTIENLKSGGVTEVNALTLLGSYLYIGGNFTHMKGGSVTYDDYTSNLGRVSVATATPSTDWNGSLNGTVNDLSGSSQQPQNDRMYAAGYFTQAHNSPAQNAAAFETASGAPLATPAWNPVWSNSNSYQRAIDAVGDRIWVGGSEHDLFQFDPATFNRLYGDIMLDKGDIQTIANVGGDVYAGCHCNYYDYQNAYAWPTLTSGWTRADGMNWFGAWNAQTGKRVPQFAPQVDSSKGGGIWALGSDSNGDLWAGGDIDSAATATKRGAWAGGFARFAPNDSAAPDTPGNVHVVSQTDTTVTLGWTSVTDESGVSYQILRDDRPIATTTKTSITVPTSNSGRFFVRAADGAGNISASSAVVKVGTGVAAPTASFTSSTDHSRVSVDGSGSSSPNGDIAKYQWDFGDGAGAVGATATHTYTAGGTYVVTLTVTDSTGTTGSVSKAITVAAPPVNPEPTDVYGHQVYQDDPWLYYRLDESAGVQTAHDSGPDARDGTYNGSLTFGTAGALANSPDTAISTDGSSGSGYVVSPSVSTVPTTFSEEIWFQTTSTSGGRLIGYSNASSGLSSNYDRHIYVRNDGKLVFGAYTGQEVEVVSPDSYNDGTWHMVVATMSPTDGMNLYVDGSLVGANPNGEAQNFSGYWRVGGDHVWDNASSNYLEGSLDEAAVFTQVLTPQEILNQYNDGATSSAPANNRPTAAFTPTMANLSGHFDASASSDSDGTIQTYRWDFGDGATANGQLVDHTYASKGSYTVTLTVTDNDGAQDSVQHSVTATAPPTDTVLIPDDATWSWQYDATAPPSDWNTSGFDASGWNSGRAVLGFGSSSIVTDIDTFSSTSQRPAAAYFTHKFQVSDTSTVTKLVLDTVADDGVVVYVNGTEVNRTSMGSGTIKSTTFASSAVRTTKAPAVTIDVPTSLLVNGTNVVAAETHLNYRATPDSSFHLKATETTTGD